MSTFVSRHLLKLLPASPLWRFHLQAHRDSAFQLETEKVVVKRLEESQSQHSWGWIPVSLLCAPDLKDRAVGPKSCLTASLCLQSVGESCVTVILLQVGLCSD